MVESIRELKDKHCMFAKLNPAGRCVAFCYYNIQQNYNADCIGKRGGTNAIQHEARLKGRRIE